MFNLQNVIGFYAGVVTLFFLWNFFRTQVSLRGKVQAIEDDMNRTFENVYRHIDDTVRAQQDRLKDTKSEISADIDSIYRTMGRIEEEMYSSSKK
jgi:pyridoxine/pyridoxamine 5'-phosphate oxidase